MPRRTSLSLLLAACAAASLLVDGRQNQFMSQLDEPLPRGAEGCEQLAALLQHCEAPNSMFHRWLPSAASTFFASNCTRQEAYLRTCLHAAVDNRLDGNSRARLAAAVASNQRL